MVGHLSKVSVDHDVDAFYPFVNRPNWTRMNQEGAKFGRSFGSPNHAIANGAGANREGSSGRESNAGIFYKLLLKQGRVIQSFDRPYLLLCGDCNKFEDKTWTRFSNAFGRT